MASLGTMRAEMYAIIFVPQSSFLPCLQWCSAAVTFMQRARTYVYFAPPRRRWNHQEQRQHRTLKANSFRCQFPARCFFHILLPFRKEWMNQCSGVKRKTTVSAIKKVPVPSLFATIFLFSYLYFSPSSWFYYFWYFVCQFCDCIGLNICFLIKFFLGLFVNGKM